MEQILITYYADNAKKLHKLVDRILLKFGGLSYKDLDDFYSLSNEVFVDVMTRYDDSQSFDAFLYSCLLNKIKTEMTRRNREKRKADRISVSIDTPIGDDENSTIGDMIASDFSIEKEVFEGNEEGYSQRMLQYLSRLSTLQKEVLRLNIAGYLPNEIREELQLSEKEYADCYAAIHSYRNVSVLF
jgi:RNA polymerase sigma factor (sigma-70 family)